MNVFYGLKSRRVLFLYYAAAGILKLNLVLRSHERMLMTAIIISVIIIALCLLQHGVRQMLDLRDRYDN